MGMRRLLDWKGRGRAGSCSCSRREAAARMVDWRLARLRRLSSSRAGMCSIRAAWTDCGVTTPSLEGGTSVRWRAHSAFGSQFVLLDTQSCLNRGTSSIVPSFKGPRRTPLWCCSPSLQGCAKTTLGHFELSSDGVEKCGMKVQVAECRICGLCTSRVRWPRHCRLLSVQDERRKACFSVDRMLRL